MPPSDEKKEPGFTDERRNTMYKSETANIKMISRLPDLSAIGVLKSKVNLLVMPENKPEVFKFFEIYLATIRSF